jgi:hypothetical protein
VIGADRLARSPAAGSLSRPVKLLGPLTHGPNTILATETADTVIPI